MLMSDTRFLVPWVQFTNTTNIRSERRNLHSIHNSISTYMGIIPTFKSSTNLFNVTYQKNIALIAQGRVKLSYLDLGRIKKKI